MKKKAPFELQPRLLTIRQTASYWGISPNTYKKLVRRGIAPGPVNPPGLGRLLYDREQQDRAIDALSGVNGIASGDADLDRELAEFIHDKG
jgi:hypothetical protein